MDGRAFIELMDVGANYLREHVKPDVRIHYAITECGGVPNIVPDKAAVWYFVRASVREDVENVYQRLVKIAEGAALMTETELEAEFLGGCYDTLNNKVLENEIHKAMLEIPQEPWSMEETAFAAKLNSFYIKNKSARQRAYGLSEKVEIQEGVLPIQTEGDGSSSDVGDVAHIVPTAFFTTACNNIGAPGHNWQITACSGHSIGEKGMMYAAKILTKAAAALMSEPELVIRAAEEFCLETSGRPYRCPLPPELQIQ